MTYNRNLFSVTADTPLDTPMTLANNVQVFHSQRVLRAHNMGLHNIAVTLHGNRVALFQFQAISLAGYNGGRLPNVDLSSVVCHLSHCGYPTPTTTRVINRCLDTIGINAAVSMRAGNMEVRAHDKLVAVTKGLATFTAPCVAFQLA